MAASERFLCDESNQEFKAWVLDFKTKQAFRSAQFENLRQQIDKLEEEHQRDWNILFEVMKSMGLIDKKLTRKEVGFRFSDESPYQLFVTIRDKNSSDEGGRRPARVVTKDGTT